MTCLTHSWEGISTFILELSPSALRPHSTGGLSARRRAKGQTGNLSVTHDPATTPWPQIHQGSVTFEFTEVIYCSKTRRLLFLEGRPCYLIKDRKWTHFWRALCFLTDFGRSQLLTCTAYKHLGFDWLHWNRMYRLTRNIETETGTRGRDALRLPKQNSWYKGNHGRL